jgi:hypothetical protein
LVSLVVSASDCEALRATWPQQPVNAWSSLAFVAAGGLLLARGRSRDTRLVGMATALVGIGSLLFHGDHNGFSGWLHDWSIAALLLFLVLSTIERPIRPVAVVGAVGGVAILSAVAPGWSNWLHAGLVVVFLAREVLMLRDRSQPASALVAVFIVGGALLTILGRTGGPWCASGAVFQPHAGWHVLVAAAIIAYSVSRGWFVPFADRGN